MSALNFLAVDDLASLWIFGFVPRFTRHTHTHGGAENADGGGGGGAATPRQRAAAAAGRTTTPEEQHMFWLNY